MRSELRVCKVRGPGHPEAWLLPSFVTTHHVVGAKKISIQRGNEKRAKNDHISSFALITRLLGPAGQSAYRNAPGHVPRARELPEHDPRAICTWSTSVLCRPSSYPDQRKLRNPAVATSPDFEHNIARKILYCTLVARFDFSGCEIGFHTCAPIARILKAKGASVTRHVSLSFFASIARPPGES